VAHHVTGRSADDGLFSQIQEQYRQAHLQANAKSSAWFFTPSPQFPVLLSRAVITSYEKTSEGQLIRAVTLPLRGIIAAIQKDPSLMYQIDPRKWEEIIAAAYDESHQFDEITLTPQSGDRGRDVIAVKNGFGSVRLIESVKRKTPGHVVTAEEVDALIGGLSKDQKASKGIVSTTWKFAPKIFEDPGIVQLIPTRLELVDGAALVDRLREYTNTQKSQAQVPCARENPPDVRVALRVWVELDRHFTK
jgi:restriction system protein